MLYLSRVTSKYDSFIYSHESKRLYNMFSWIKQSDVITNWWKYLLIWIDGCVSYYTQEREQALPIQLSVCSHTYFQNV